MYAVLTLILHALISNATALVLARHGVEPVGTSWSLYSLCLVSAVLSVIGLAATASYLSRRIRPISGVLTGILSGLLCSGIMGLALTNMDYSLILYLAILAPTLLSVLLASLLDRPKSGWQT